MYRVVSVLLCLAACISGCTKASTKPVPIHAYVTFSTGDVRIFRAGSVINALPRTEVVENDLIKTGEKSQVVLQVSDRDIVSISEKSELQIQRIKQSSEVSLYLRKGEVLSKVTKLGKGEQYLVHTPTLTAGVRGTEFCVSATSRAEKVAVLSGKVILDGATVGEQRTINKLNVDGGKTVLISISSDGKEPTVSARDITAEDRTLLQKISGAEILPDVMNIKNDEEDRVHQYFQPEKAVKEPASETAQAIPDVTKVEEAPVADVEKEAPKADDAHVIAMAKSEDAVSMKTFKKEGVTLLFAENSDVLSDQAKALVDKKFGLVATELNKDAKLAIVGYSEIGSPMTKKFNTELSYSRAYLVAQYLMGKYGFAKNNIFIDGKGPDSPISSDRSSEGRKLNRRVEIDLDK